ncbi:MAG: T9SS type A sorting domain-containing protein [Lentimicrobium sp.]
MQGVRLTSPLFPGCIAAKELSIVTAYFRLLSDSQAIEAGMFTVQPANHSRDIRDFSENYCLTEGVNYCIFEFNNFRKMKKIFLFLFLLAVVQEVYPQWTLLSTDFEPNISITAFDSTVISGSSSFGPYDLTVSYDNGNTWSGSNLLQSGGVIYLCTDDPMIYACTPDGIYRTEKETLNWSTYNEGLPDGQINKIILKDSIILASGNNSIYLRISGDPAWTALVESSPVGGISDFDYDGNTLVLAGYDGIAESNDLGLSWNLWPPAYVFEWDAVTVKGDTIIAASKGGVYRKLIPTGTISNVSNGLMELWNPYGYDYYGEFEQFHCIDDHIFMCGETGVYKLSDYTWDWESTGPGNWTDALASNDEMLYAVKGYGGIWSCPLNQLIVNTNEVPLIRSPISLYPNPVNNIITIGTQQITPGNNTSLSIINLQGQQLTKIRLTKPTTVLDVRAFAPGMYFAKITDGPTVKTVKFLKQE